MDSENTIVSIITPDGPFVVLPPPVISMTDILSSVELLTQKEATDKSTLESIGAIPFDDLKSKLLTWGTLGFPNIYEIYRVAITPPTVCSDGVSRSLGDYIEFCSGKPIQDHVAVLQQRVQDMTISFTNMGTYIGIVVTKA
jgi:hypothetical protein